MRKEFIALFEGAEFEYTEKKSRFLAQTFPVKGVEEIEAFLDSVRKRYYDARHHCYAYCFGERYENSRISDDGEPTGTAGKPIFDVISGAGVTDCLAVVTRYFGGTLLGTGGLVRAYSAAAKGALDVSILVRKIPALRYEFSADYADWGKLQYLFSQRGISPETVYGQEILVRYDVPEEQAGSVEKSIVQLTSGKAVPKKLQESWLQQDMKQ
ncbi:MAG: YigZ family protein [Lachnospiraceae bacterium]|nr:YigZ family protein [Lachnospiraceae bacterium]